MDLNNMSNRLSYSIPMPGGQNRLREMILYISKACEKDTAFCSTKLNKILYHSDFNSYAGRGVPITGRSYKCIDNGPAPFELRPLRREMVNCGDLEMKTVEFHGKTQHRTIALRDPDTRLFQDEDLKIVNDIIKKLWGKTAKEVSDESHDVRYYTRGLNNKLPYQAAYLSSEEITREDIEKTRKLASKYGWSS